MTKQELKEVFLLDSWLDLYNFLRMAGHAGKEFVEVSEPAPRASAIVENNAPMEPVTLRKWVLKIADVKCMAFDELYSRLPLHDSVQLMQEVIGEVAQYAPHHRSLEMINSFITNIPTRSK